MSQINYQFIEKIKSLPFVEGVYLFGSRARGDNRSRSDIDLAISCPKATKGDWKKVQNIIEDADTLLEVDYVRIEDVNPALTMEIQGEGIRL